MPLSDDSRSRPYPYALVDAVSMVSATLDMNATASMYARCSVACFALACMACSESDPCCMQTVSYFSCAVTLFWYNTARALRRSSGNCMSHSAGENESTLGYMLVSSRIDFHACLPMMDIIVLLSRVTSSPFLLPLPTTCSSAEVEVEVDAVAARSAAGPHDVLECASEAVAGLCVGCSMPTDAERTDGATDAVRTVDFGLPTDVSRTADATDAVRTVDLRGPSDAVRTDGAADAVRTADLCEPTDAERTDGATDAVRTVG